VQVYIYMCVFFLGFTGVTNKTILVPIKQMQIAGHGAIECQVLCRCSDDGGEGPGDDPTGA
jgi:hypothetical protein